MVCFFYHCPKVLSNAIEMRFSAGKAEEFFSKHLLLLNAQSFTGLLYAVIIGDEKALEDLMKDGIQPTATSERHPFLNKYIEIVCQ